MIRMMRSRRGDWIQIFMLLFFALLLIFAIALLTIESKRLQVERPELADDFIAQKASTVLISFLRTEIAIDCSGMKGKDTIAAMIIINDGSCDENIKAAVKNYLTDTPVAFTVQYTDRAIEMSNSKSFAQVVWQKRATEGRTGWMLGKGYALLPGREGNIQVTYLIPSNQTITIYKLTKEELQLTVNKNAGSTQ